MKLCSTTQIFIYYKISKLVEGRKKKSMEVELTMFVRQRKAMYHSEKERERERERERESGHRRVFFLVCCCISNVLSRFQCVKPLLEPNFRKLSPPHIYAARVPLHVFTSSHLAAQLSKNESPPPFCRVSLGLTGGRLWRCPWCNGYRRRIWTRRHEFKSWTRLIAFHIALIPLRKVWVNSRTDWVLQPWEATSLGEGKLWIKTC